MAAGTMVSSRRVNVLPTSTILNQRFEDVDCSGTDFAAVPEDGQFIQAPGKVGYNSHADTFCAVQTSDVTVGRNAALAMVYSGGANRSDIQALGGKRVPVIRGNIRVRTKAFVLADDAQIPSHANNAYAEGGLLTVIVSPDAVQGTANRLFLYPVAAYQASGETSAWVVGRIARITNDSAVPGTGEIEVELFANPYIHVGDVTP